jgi:hypothetical protein
LQVVSLLDALRLIGQVRVLHGMAKPARVVPSSEVKQPRFFIDALGYLAESCQIVSLEIVPVCRAAEVEAPIPHIALGVFPEMAQPINTA